ncbi:hypothetical protein BC939DRAFT_465925 [Gamsiella multidivaricata]|uniref:uncharacterized protein n=1 Tax=Gamsiella multidivaricata TaxID=101098 RepID=UPI00221E42F3|nr:uncharacterized protein BC939DRAFT_465925 [Gamsiella multidivaricata]KAI7817458.1 hypothetical protein BC939DRAFT_465925 [Gamsiella multidivaricata]
MKIKLLLLASHARAIEAIDHVMPRPLVKSFSPCSHIVLDQKNSRQQRTRPSLGPHRLQAADILVQDVHRHLHGLRFPLRPRRSVLSSSCVSVGGSRFGVRRQAG